MSQQTQTEFFQAHQVDGNLTDAQTAQMLNLPEGDTAALTAESGKPDAAQAPATAPAAGEGETKTEPPAASAEPAAQAQPVVLAKDGVHTIPFEKLVEAREEAQRLKTELDALKKAPPAPAPAAAAPEPAAPAAADTALDLGDFSEEAIAKGLGKGLDARVAAIAETLEKKLTAAVAPLQKTAQEAADEAHFGAIAKAHPDVESVVPSAEFAAWKQSQPTYAQAAIDKVVTDGSAKEVIEVLDNFKAATGKPAPAAPAPPAAPAVDPAKVAAEAIAKAAVKPPSSLSEVPAGAAVQHDEATAMLEMSPEALLNKFQGKSPAQIEALMNRVV